tara:strand:+ start:2354 stop:3823 length:1470 start_codon:yes stop_codon:yes gene_type:complete
MKTKYIENGLIIINLILVLYLVYVLSNRTIETFYSNQGCEGLCNNSWSKPELPRLISANMELIDNHLYVSSIQLDGTIDERFENVWFLKFTLSQGEVNSGYHEKLFSIGDAGAILEKVNDQYNIFSISNILQTPDAWLKFKIKIDLKDTVPLTTGDFKIKLSILDEDMVEQTPIIEEDFPYKPCNEDEGTPCGDYTDCCNGMVCAQNECSYDCPPGFYKNGQVCELCPSTGKTSDGNDITGCVACNAGTYRKLMGHDQSQCSPCLSGTYRTTNMTDCSDTCISPDYSPYQIPNPDTLAECVDCEAGYAADSAGNACAQSCYDLGKIPNAEKSACVDCNDGQKPNPTNKNECIPCEETDYDSWTPCSTYICKSPSTYQTGYRKTNVANTCPQTRDKECICHDPCRGLGLHHVHGYSCCRPVNRHGSQDGPSDCGGENDHAKRSYPCCPSPPGHPENRCRLVTYGTKRVRRGGRGGGWRTINLRGHRCIND